MTTKASITFHGGVAGVTGSNFLFEVAGKRILVDCGLFQGCDTCADKNFEPFPYDPSSIDYVFVTHGHLDHAGRIPKLVHDGFAGKIISTPPTRDVAHLIFEDGLNIFAMEAKRKGITPLYSTDDVSRSLQLWDIEPLGKNIDLGGGIVAVMRNAGHIIGSSMVEFIVNGKRIVFSGDLGNSPTPLLPDTEACKNADYLIVESTYGDRVHESKDIRSARLEDIIENTIKQKGVLIIPAFSIERTQEILYETEKMIENAKFPPLPVYLDSPLGIRVTDVYARYKDFLNPAVAGSIEKGDDIFRFPQLRLTHSAGESHAIWNTPNPKIIIAGSGMSNGGRVVAHEKRYLGDKTTTLLIVGYQAPESLGRLLQEGVKIAEIDGEKISVRARIETILGYSAHRDINGLLSFVQDSADTLKKVFVVMGELKSSTFFAQRIKDFLAINAVVPQLAERFELDL